MTSFDVIVIGCGGVGSATLECLASNGVSVLGIEQFSMGHSLGSSHGKTRIIRQAYFEHPNYVPLLFEAYDTWHRLEAATETRLYHRTGLLEAGPPDGDLISGIKESVRLHNLRVDEYTNAEARSEFPAFSFSDDQVAVYEHDAGYLEVDTCVRVQLKRALRLGAEVVDNCAVRQWRSVDAHIEVQTDQQTYSCASLVISPGAWAASTPLLGLSGADALDLHVVKKHVHWYRANNNCYDLSQSTPIFFFETDDGGFYGFPVLDGSGLKVAEHSGGESVTDPSSVSRDIDKEDRLRIESFLRATLPQSRFEASEHSVCFYTMTPDGHFIVDRHPQSQNVFLACGMSGHGFKFTRLLGEKISNAVLHGTWDERLNFLSANRFGV